MSRPVQPRLKELSRRRRLSVFEEEPFPAYVVWELTLRCDHACRHCGSRAGAPRADELSTAECLDLVGQLAAMDTQEVVLIGGEAYLHEGFLDIVGALRQSGIYPSMVTGGLGITAQLARDMAAAGMQTVSVSVDGLQSAHDRLRRRGSFEAATRAIRHVRAAGMSTGANSNLNRTNRADLEGLYEHLRDAGVSAWQLQITVPMGRAADRPDMMLQPWDLLDLMPRIAEVKRQARAEGMLVMPGNNLGYFGPEEALLRSVSESDRDCFCGCFAGKYVLGLQSNGAIKGCLSLMSDSYVCANTREQRLADTWQQSQKLSFTRKRDIEALWGFCRQCPFAEVCMGGCTFTSHAAFGRPGNNPYCHYRARHFAKEGKRERLVAVDRAPGAPMDEGVYEIVVEPLAAPDPLDQLTEKEQTALQNAPVSLDDKSCR